MANIKIYSNTLYWPKQHIQLKKIVTSIGENIISHQNAAVAIRCLKMLSLSSIKANLALLYWKHYIGQSQSYCISNWNKHQRLAVSANAIFVCCSQSGFVKQQNLCSIHPLWMYRSSVTDRWGEMIPFYSCKRRDCAESEVSAKSPFLSTEADQTRAFDSACALLCPAPHAASERFASVLISRAARALWAEEQNLLKGRKRRFWLSSVPSEWSKWKPLDWILSQASSAALWPDPLVLLTQRLSADIPRLKISLGTFKHKCDVRNILLFLRNPFYFL